MLRSHYADLCLAVSDNPDVFGSNLVQYGFAKQTTVTGIVGTLGITNYQKSSKLLEVVDSRFNTSTPGQSAKDFFDCFVLILGNKLGHNDIAQALVATYSKLKYYAGINISERDHIIFLAACVYMHLAVQ